MRDQFSLRNFKISMLLLVATTGLAVAWSFLPHVWFIVVVITAVGSVLSALAGRNGWRQTSLAGPPRASVTGARHRAAASATGARHRAVASATGARRPAVASATGARPAFPHRGR